MAQNNRRRPGEDAVDWTVRNAELSQHDNGYWYIHHTIVLPNGKYRTAVISTRTRDKAGAYEELTHWGRDYARDMRTAPTPRVVTFGDAAARYLTDTRPRRLTTAQDYAVDWCARDLRGEPVSGIDKTRLSAWHAEMARRGLSIGTIRRRLAVALTVLRHAADVGLLPPGDVPRYRSPPVPAPRDYTLSAEEDARVFAAAAGWGERQGTEVAHRTGLFVCLALDSAQRKEAVLALTWERVFMPRGGPAHIDFTDPGHAPGNKRRCAHLPVQPRLLAILEREAARSAGRPTGRVFGSQRLNFQGFETFRAAMGLPRLTPHVFRHTWASLALARGVPMATVAYVLADSVATVARTYNHHSQDMARTNLDRFNQPLPPPAPDRGRGDTARVA